MNFEIFFLNKPQKLFIFLIVSALFYFILGFGYPNLWNYLLVANNPNLTFSDFRCVQQWGSLYNFFLSESSQTYSHITECILNHPRIWIPISKILNLKSEYNFYLLIFILISIYIYIFYYYIKKFHSYFLLYFFFSGASLLLLERGNNDLIVFVILFFSLNTHNIFFSYIFYLMSIILKIFPLFGLLGYLSKFKNIKIIILFILPVVFYFIITYEDLAKIFYNTPRSGDMSFGSYAIEYNLFKHFKLKINSVYISIVLILFTFLVYFSIRKKFLVNLKFLEESSFLVGSCIYSCLFVISSSYDYRLVFLLFSIPCIIKLNSNIIKYTLLISIAFSSELYRLLLIFGFYGGIVNSIFKLVLFVLLSVITMEILFRIIKKNFYKLKV